MQSIPESLHLLVSHTLIVWRYLDHIFKLKVVGSYENPGKDPIMILGRILSGSQIRSYQDAGR